MLKQHENNQIQEKGPKTNGIAAINAPQALRESVRNRDADIETANKKLTIRLRIV